MIIDKLVLWTMQMLFSAYQVTVVLALLLFSISEIFNAIATPLTFLLLRLLISY